MSCLEFTCLPTLGHTLSPIPAEVGGGLCGSVQIKRHPQVCLSIRHAFLVPTKETERIVVNFTDYHLPPYHL